MTGSRPITLEARLAKGEIADAKRRFKRRPRLFYGLTEDAATAGLSYCPRRSRLQTIMNRRVENRGQEIRVTPKEDEKQWLTCGGP